MRYDLFINGRLCDLNEQSLIVLTYTMEQLNNPTAVKNTYSHEVELPHTANNDKIFSHFYRNDYKVGRANYSPLERVPFAIYNELGEIAESGYIKLQEVKIDNRAHTYKVTLYGGLGQFFYSMTYTDNGDALSLADLQYMQSAEYEGRLDFSIFRYAVAQAWSRLGGAPLTSANMAYDVINFAPTYQGIPDGEFDAGKALYLALANLNTTTGAYENTLRNPIYGVNVPQDGYKMLTRRTSDLADTGWRYTLVELNREYSEWEAKDLRSYMQRPVLSVRKFVEAVQRRATEKGFTLNLDSAFFNDNNPYYNKAWLTLPSLTTLTRNSNDAEVQLSTTFANNTASNQTLIVTASELAESDGYDFGSTVTKATLTIPKVSISVPTADAEIQYVGLANTGSDYFAGTNPTRIAWFYQLYATNSLGSVTGASDVVVLVDEQQGARGETIATQAGYIPRGNPEYRVQKGAFRRVGNQPLFEFYNKGTIGFTLTMEGGGEATNYYFSISKRVYKQGDETIPVSQVVSAVGELGYFFPIDYASGESINAYGNATVKANANVRSGAIIRKRELLDIGKTPLEVLLSYCKLFGLVWHYEGDSRTIDVMTRPTFYGGGTALDWSVRIDHSREIVIKPFEFDKRFYDFELEAQGEWAEEYADKYGYPYGRQRVNTGYTFDAEKKNLLEGNALKGGAEVLEMSKHFCNIREDGKICPSVFLDGGGTFTMEYYATSAEKEFDVIPPTREATISYFQSGMQGYDYLSKLQLQSDNAPIGDAGTLLFFGGVETITADSPYRNLKLSDDTAEMSLLNGGTPCYVLEGGDAFSMVGEPLPHFVRTMSVGEEGYSLDMGIPQEVDNPLAGAEVEGSIYSRFWARYLADRYDDDSRVLTCYVDLRGVQVNNALFRNFYYFDNAVWVLNRIINYSITTEGTTQCEFVKVQDVNNYREA